MRTSLLAAVSGLLFLLMAIGSPQQASAAGKFDGEWKGQLNCSKIEPFGKSRTTRIRGTEIRSKVELTILNDRVINQSGFYSGKIEASASKVKINTTLPKVGSLLIEGTYLEADGERLIDFDSGGTQDDESECRFFLTWSGGTSGQLAASKSTSKPTAVSPSPQQASDESREAVATERQRLAKLKRKQEEDQRIAEAEKKRKAEAQRLAGFEKKLKERERRLVEAENKRKAESKRLAKIEQKRQEEALQLAAADRKRKADLKRKRQDEAKRLAGIERKRKEKEARQLAEVKRKKKAETQRLASIEKKRKKAEAKKRKAAQQTASTIGGGGQLRKQLAFIKQLRADGFIDEQEFKSQKRLLLARFLGLKSAPSAKSSPTVKRPEDSKIKKNLAKYSDVKFGNYHALVIGSNDYKYLPKLKTAKTDAKAVAKTLKSKYGYKVKTLINATRQNILDAFDEYRETLTKTENLLIYYAGHGYLDEDDNRGYWMPVDARPNRQSAWLSNADITANLKAIKANHVMVMADSCYSGTLTRGLSIKERSPDYVRKAVAKKARVVITSGGLEPVADKSGGAHSPFASVFLDVLNSNNGVLDGTKLFNKMRRPVMLKADQTPQYADVRKAGHEGGDFLFVRRR